MYSDFLNLLDFFFGADKLIYWQLLILITVILSIAGVMLVCYKEGKITKTLIKENGFKIVLIILILIVFCLGGLFTYYYNLPLGEPMELIIR